MSTSSESSSESVVIEKRKRKRSTIVKQTNNSDTSDDHTSDDSDENADNEKLEPVLSHAEKRRRKKEAKRAEKLKDDDELQPKKKRKLKDGTSQTVDATTKRQNSVWVGNMSYKTQHEDLQEFFQWVGEITRVYMPMKVRGGPGSKPENRGCVFVVFFWLWCSILIICISKFSFAYVDFATPEAKIAAIALSERPLFGRKLLIKDGNEHLQLFPKFVTSFFFR